MERHTGHIHNSGDSRILSDVSNALTDETVLRRCSYYKQIF